MNLNKVLEIKPLIDEYLENYLKPVVYFETVGIKHSFDDIETKPSFQEMLFKFIDSKKLNEVEVYKKADIDRKHFSKIRSNIKYNPLKKTVIKLIFGLELNFDEAEELLESAGFTLSESLKADMIVRYFIDNKIFDLDLLFDTLYCYNETL